MENLILNDITVHEIFRRADNGDRVEPQYSNRVVHLDRFAKRALEARIIGAVGKASHSVDLDIADMGDASAFQYSKSAVHATEADFIENTKNLTNKLSEAQTSRNIPGGIVIVFRGTVGITNKKVLGIIKAEPNGGFTRGMDENGDIELTFIKDLFLTAQARLYKMGLFIFDINDADTKATIYDENITERDRHAAARYFYEGFLDCVFPEDNAKRTKDFFIFTRDFINKLDVNDDIKVDLYTSLYTYLKIDQSPNIHAQHFANQYLPSDSRDPYIDFMGRKRFPANAVLKDLQDVNPLLKRRKLKFKSNIQLSAPEGVFEELITIDVVEAQEGQPMQTIITVNDSIASQS